MTGSEIETDYANYLGSGNRTGGDLGVQLEGDFGGVGTGDTLINGVFFDNDLTFVAPLYIRFDFPDSRYIDEFRWRQSGVEEHGTWRLRGSHDGLDYTTVCSAFTLGGFPTSEYPCDNPGYYPIYQLEYVSGTVGELDYINEIEFKIDYVDPPEPPTENNGPYPTQCMVVISGV